MIKMKSMKLQIQMIGHQIIYPSIKVICEVATEGIT